MTLLHQTVLYHTVLYHASSSSSLSSFCALPCSHCTQASLTTLLEHVVRRLRFLSSLPPASPPPSPSPVLSSSAYSLLSALNEAAPTAVMLHGMQVLLTNQNAGVQRRVMRLLADKARADAEAKRREVWGVAGKGRKEKKAPGGGKTERKGEKQKQKQKQADSEAERKAEEAAERHRRALFLSLLREDAVEYAAICSQLVDIASREGEKGGESRMDAGAAGTGSGDGSLVATRQVALQVGCIVQGGKERRGHR